MTDFDKIKEGWTVKMGTTVIGYVATTNKTVSGQEVITLKSAMTQSTVRETTDLTFSNDNTFTVSGQTNGKPLGLKLSTDNNLNADTLLTNTVSVSTDGVEKSSNTVSMIATGTYNFGSRGLELDSGVTFKTTNDNKAVTLQNVGSNLTIKDVTGAADMDLTFSGTFSKHLHLQNGTKIITLKDSTIVPTSDMKESIIIDNANFVKCVNSIFKLSTSDHRVLQDEGTMANLSLIHI